MLPLPLAMHCVPVEDQEPAHGLFVGTLFGLHMDRQGVMISDRNTIQTHATMMCVCMHAVHRANAFTARTAQNERFRV